MELQIAIPIRFTEINSITNRYVDWKHPQLRSINKVEINNLALKLNIRYIRVKRVDSIEHSPLNIQSAFVQLHLSLWLPILTYNSDHYSTLWNSRSITLQLHYVSLFGTHNSVIHGVFVINVAQIETSCCAMFLFLL